MAGVLELRYYLTDADLTNSQASLDIEYIMSTGQGIPTTFWSTGGLHDNQEPFLKWMIDVDNAKKVPLLFSVRFASSLRPHDQFI